MLRAEIVLRHGLLEKQINTVELNDETGKIIVKGNGYQGVDSDLLKLYGLNLDLKTELKVGDSEIFTKYIARNILRSYMKGLIIPKRKINRGEGTTIEKAPKYEENNTANEQEDQQQEEEQPQEEISESKPKPPPMPRKIPQEKPKPKPEPPKQETPPPKQPSPPPKQPSPPPKQTPPPPKKPPPPPRPSKIEEKREPSPPKVEIASSNSKGVPPPPPPPPPPPVIKTIKSSSSKSSKPVDLAAELAAKKKNLTKVETKDLSIPNVQATSTSSSSQSGNSMMDAIMAKRNAMKRVSAPQIQSSSIKKTETQPKKPVAAPKKTTTTTTQVPKTNTNSALKKTPTSSTKTSIKPTSSTKVSAFSSKPTNTGAKQPLKMSAGGTGGFAAMRNMLANRMGPQPTKKQDEAPKKPIVELAKGNVPRMNMSKLMASLESNMGKSESTSNEPIKVVSSSGKGVPPPPPPPPPPPVK